MSDITWPIQPDPNAPGGLVYFLNQTYTTNTASWPTSTPLTGMAGTISGGTINWPIQGLGQLGGQGFGQTMPWPAGDPNCAHEAWEVLGSDPVGYGTCQNCGGRYGLPQLLNGLRDRLLSLITQVEQKLAEE